MRPLRAQVLQVIDLLPGLVLVVDLRSEPSQPFQAFNLSVRPPDRVGGCVGVLRAWS